MRVETLGILKVGTQLHLMRMVHLSTQQQLSLT